MDSAPIDVRIARHIKVHPVSGCWEWQGWKSPNGYAMMRFNTKKRAAHRVSAHFYLGLDLSKTKIFVCHKCDNPPCVNPEHLFLGTAKDNVQDSIRKGRARSGGRHRNATHCIRGHELSGSNLYIKDRRYRGAGFERVCIACQREREAVWWSRERLRRRR